MLSFRLLRHAVLMLFHDPRATLNVAWPLLAAMALTTLLSVIATPHVPGAMMGPMGMSPAIVLILAAGNTAIFLATAVAWHRHVLRGDAPRIVAPGRLRQMLTYAGTGIVIALIIMVPVFLGMAIMSLTMGGMGMGMGRAVFAMATMIVLMVLFMALGLRLLTALPGAALREPAPIRRAWRATGGQWRCFLSLAVMIFVLQSLPSLVPAAIASVTYSALLAGIVAVLMSWAWALAGLSLATTLWGHMVEGRDLR
ncbi:hypothetical protein Q4511_04865 [Paracoccus sp. 1_MG-2023]|uniref:hypothetical protein n=1 Tax=unclassified Paracoccus (in: a-proteobacteria) TaxID=2688777 RepID=UPI001C08890B|nr:MULTISPECIES: hypothetical protein [unclassified Paracoccus (in: a-proteobacteria)]MBU2957049.1 hypothetical protein [Paracoccus sp. C2R09]MDO6668247.1 hypothetical protein [Paracoccus sp. 1_MG-2023]